MLRIECRFPLGVYHALSAESFGRPEWPPSPVRLIGALLAAAHESDAVDTDAGRALLGRLCDQEPPEIVAPKAAWFEDVGIDGRATVAAVRGASRWAPRNHTAGEIKKEGVSPRNLARDRTEVHKGGVVIGSQPVEIRWPSLELDASEASLLRDLAGEATFLGAARSPAIFTVRTDPPPASVEGFVWRAASSEAVGATEIRVPIPSLLGSFDARHAARVATGKKAVDKAGHVPNTAMGATVPYIRADDHRRQLAGRPLEPEHWGEMIVLEVDGEKSEFRPMGAAAYLVARAFREALLGAYGEIGAADEAPPVLRGHGDEPHAAFVPLPFVGTVRTIQRKSGAEDRVRLISADGLVRGIAVVLPHEARLADVAEQRLRVEAGLRAFVGEGQQRWIDVPGAGKLVLRLPDPGRTPLLTLRDIRYRKPSNTWESVIPVVHARRRTSTGPRGIQRQVAADCAHVGLPEPVEIEVLAEPPLGGAPGHLLPGRAVPPEWRDSLNGPRSHLRLRFERPIAGPVLLGRGRHFGTGLMVPKVESREEEPAEEPLNGTRK